jgi:hypothetical protein
MKSNKMTVENSEARNRRQITQQSSHLARDQAVHSEFAFAGPPCVGHQLTLSRALRRSTWALRYIEPSCVRFSMIDVICEQVTMR